MSDIVLHATAVRVLSTRVNTALAVPEPKLRLRIRPGVLSDLEFMDALQKQHSHELGFLYRETLIGKIKLGQVLIAEVVASGQLPVVSHDEDISGNWQLTTGNSPIGYLIGQDYYNKNESCGIIYHVAVVDEFKRSLVGAALVRAQFERSAYGCKLYCCWTRQDLAANFFWQNLGFVPVAFRTGGRSKAKPHIFWQKRIRHGDTSTPWWYPCATDQGQMAEGRIVLPLLEGMNWQDDLPLAFPEMLGTSKLVLDVEKPVKIPKKDRPPSDRMSTVARGGFSFSVPQKESKEKEKVKLDPVVKAKARDLRDHFLERVNEGNLLSSQGKYDLNRQIESKPDTPMLAA